MSEGIDLAWFQPYVALLKVLHGNKVLAMDDVVAALGDTIDFAAMKHMPMPSKETEVAVYNALRQIADAQNEIDRKLGRS